MTDEKLNHAAMNLVGELQLMKPENYYEVARRLMQKYAAAEIEALQAEVKAWKLAALSCGLYRADVPHSTSKEWQTAQVNAQSVLLNERDSLRSTVAELEKYNERLDWLIAHCVDDDSSVTQNNGEVCLMAASRYKTKDILQVIDTAMSAEKK